MIDHLSIQARDVDAAVTFYLRVATADTSPRVHADHVIVPVFARWRCTRGNSPRGVLSDRSALGKTGHRRKDASEQSSVAFGRQQISNQHIRRSQYLRMTTIP